jgi:hypothetical protein
MCHIGIAFAATYTQTKLVAGLYQQAAELAPELAGLAIQPTAAAANVTTTV